MKMGKESLFWFIDPGSFLFFCSSNTSSVTLSFEHQRLQKHFLTFHLLTFKKCSLLFSLCVPVSASLFPTEFYFLSQRFSVLGIGDLAWSLHGIFVLPVVNGKQEQRMEWDWTQSFNADDGGETERVEGHISGGVLIKHKNIL